ncbi:MAG: hypothetical protein ACRENW_08400 [Thermodesulfobacteriota bacterium]
MRAEKDVRLRIDLLESQSSAIARILAKAIREHNDGAYKEYSDRLDANRGKMEELLWVLGEKAGQGILDLYVSGSQPGTAGQTFERVKSGELKMAGLQSDVPVLIRRGAMELKSAKKA